MKCPLCEGKIKKSKEKYFFNGIELGEFEAEKCIKCNEVFFSEKASDEIDLKAKKLGLWGNGEKAKIGISGNSLIIRIPKKIAKITELEKGQTVFIHPEGKNKIMIEA